MDEKGMFRLNSTSVLIVDQFNCENFEKRFSHSSWVGRFISSIHFGRLVFLLTSVRFWHCLIFFLDWNPRNCFTICRTVSRFMLNFFAFSSIETFRMYSILFTITLHFLGILTVRFRLRPSNWNRFTASNTDYLGTLSNQTNSRYFIPIEYKVRIAFFWETLIT